MHGHLNVNLTILIHSLLISAPDGDEWSTSRSTPFTPREITSLSIE